MASFIEGVLKAYPDQRILIVTHVRELIEQNFLELLNLWPEAPAGIYSAGLKQRDIQARILFAGIQSIHKRVYDVQQCDLVLIDEAHLIPRKSNTHVPPVPRRTEKAQSAAEGDRLDRHAVSARLRAAA